MQYSIYNILILCFTIASAHQLKAQQIDHNKPLSEYQINYWNTDVGLSSNSIISLHQSKNGYLWIGTYSGLHRFDGKEFKLYNRPSNLEITHDGIRDITEDANGNIWIGTNGGGLLTLVNDEIVAFTVKDGLLSNQVYSLKMINKHQMLIGTSNGLNLMEFNNGAYTIKSILDASFHQLVFKIAFDEKKNQILLATNDGLFIVEYNNEQAKITKHLLPKDEIMDIQLGDEGMVWIASYTSGLYYLLDDEIRIFEPTRTLKFVSNIVIKHGNTLFIGTDNGFYRYHQGKLSMLDEQNGLPDANISSSLIDHEGNIWLGSYYGGLIRVKNATFYKFTQEDGLHENVIHHIYEESPDNYWICTDNGINQIKDDQVIAHEAINDLLPSKKTRFIQKDKKGNYWIACYGGLLRYRSPQDYYLFQVKDGLSNNQIRTLYIDHQDQLWVGTRKGLNQIRFDNGQYHSKQITLSEGFTNEMVTHIEQNAAYQIMVSTTYGFYKLKADGYEKVYPIDKDFNGVIFHFLQDSESQLIWLSTSEGTKLLKDGKEIPLTDENNYLKQTSYFLIKDPLNHLWICTENGVLSTDLSTLTLQIKDEGKAKLNVQLYTRDDGLPTNHSTPAAKGMLSSNRLVWLPSLSGVSVVNPQKIYQNQVPPPVNIEYLVADKVKIIPNDKPIRIKDRIKNLEIKFTGLSLFAPEKVSFKYMLEGYDTEWQNSGTRRVAFYTNLPPNNYTFKVIAANNDNIWNVEGAKIKFSVLPPIWQKAWFISLIVVGIILLLALLHRLRTNSIKQANKKLELLIEERTMEIKNQKEEIETQRDDIERKNSELAKAHDQIGKQNKALEKANLNLEEKVESRTHELQRANIELDEFVYKASHDIKGPLVRILGLCKLALLETEEDTARMYFQKLKREASLTDLALKKLIKARNVKNTILHIESINIADLFHQKLAEVKEQEEIQHVDVQLDIEKGLKWPTDQFMLGNILFHLFENAVQFTDLPTPKIHVKAVLTENQDELTLIVMDKGFGIVQQAKGQIFDMFYKGTNRSTGPGLGLYIAKIAAERIAASIQLISSKAGETIFEVVIPKMDEPEKKNKAHEVV